MKLMGTVLTWNRQATTRMGKQILVSKYLVARLADTRGHAVLVEVVL